MTIGMLVVIVAIFFVIGNIMSLKPKISEVRVGEMRLFARKMDLNPKLVATPDWLSKQESLVDVKTNRDQTMMAQYAVIDDEWRLPARRLLWTGQHWQAADDDLFTHALPVPPTSFLPYLRGLSIKANCVILYWQDERYVKSFAIRDDKVMTRIEQDLMTLKVFLQDMGNQCQSCG